MSNYNFSNTLDGLNNIDANQINTDNIVTDYLTVNINSAVPLVTPFTANTNQIASCAFVQDAFINNLSGYAKLNPVTTQTFTGTNVFGVLQANTPTVATNSTRVATTAYVKSNLLNYAVLAPGTPQTFTGENIFDTLRATTPGTSTNSTIVATTAYVKSNLANYVTTNTDQTITGNKTFTASTWVSGSDLRVLDISSNQGIQIFNSNDANNNTTLQGIGANSKFQIRTRDATTQRTNINIQNGNQVTIQGTANEGIDILNNQITMNGNLALNKLFVSNYVDVTLTTYENQFYGDIYGYRGIVCQDGLYIKDGPGPGANTYALIDTSGNISTTTTITATGNISSNTGIISSNSSNQISIRDPANIGPSTISQTGNTMTITAISSNASPQTTLTLATRSAANIQSILLSGNTTNLNLGTNSNTTIIQSPNLNINSSNINTAAITSTVNGGPLTFNNTLTTFTDNVTFNITTSFNDSLLFYNGIGGTNSTQFYQNGANLNIYTNGGGIKLGAGFTDNIVCTTNRAYLQGSGGNTIDINGTQATIGGTSVPKITTQPATASNTNEIASTAFVKNQGYATTASLSSYALLTATQTFTGTQTFTATAPTQPLVIKNTTSSNSGGLIVSGVGSYNGINSTGDFSVIGFGPTIDNGTLTLTTWASNSSGIKINRSENRFYNPFGAWYNSLSPVPTLNVYDIGYNFISAGATWANWVGNTLATPDNIVTLTFNGIGDYKKGTWLVDIVLSTNCATPPDSYLIWTTVGPTSGAYNTTCAHSKDSGFYNGASTQALRMSFVLIVSTIPTTYYLNYNRMGGVGLAENKTHSQISFTRMG